MITHRKAKEKIYIKELIGNKLLKTLMDFKSEFTNKFQMFEKRFTTYADVTNETITTNLNNTTSEVTEK